MNKIVQKLKKAFVPTEDNGHNPLFLTSKAISVYAILTMLIMALLFSGQNLADKKLFAKIAENIVITQTNAQRETQALLPLEHNEKLAQAAQMKAEDMIARDYFSHNSPEGERPWVWLQKVEYDYALAGENLAIDFFDEEPLTKAWMNSPSHAQNILNNYFTDIGIGVAEGEFEGRQTTVVVMFLGREITPTLQAIAEEDTTEPAPEPTPAPEPAPEPEPQPEPTPEPAPEPEPEPQPEVLPDVSPVPPQEMAADSNVKVKHLEEEKNILLGENGYTYGATQEEIKPAPSDVASSILLNITRSFFGGLILLSVFSVATHHSPARFAVPRVFVLGLFLSALMVV